MTLLAAGGGETALMVLLGVGAAGMIAVVVIYNRLVSLRTRVRESWSGIDTELKRRHNLIPNLVQTVKGYGAHEREVLEGVVELRGSAQRRLQADDPDPDNVADGERELGDGVSRLIALAEKYPQLKADEHFRRLMEELALTEDRIQAARRFYNANVRDLNNLVQMFPSNLIANASGFERARFFELPSAAERIAPPVECGPDD